MHVRPTPSLPAVIGPTENALRALLRSVLSGSPVASYEEWVGLNVLDRSSGPSGVHALAAELCCSIDEAGATIDHLVQRGLVEVDAGLSATGRAALLELRPQIAVATAQVTADLDPHEVEVTRAVLNRVRNAAIAERQS